METEASRTCVECQGRMSAIVIIDKKGGVKHLGAESLEYRLPDDRLKFWSGKYPTAGPVLAFMCEDCGRIALYAGKQDAQSS
jgi:hypothetical protein